MSKKNLARAAAFCRQGGCCYYCDKPMWLDDPARFGREHGLPARRLKSLQATAEHLTARRDGGTNAWQNIAAVHALCNRRRHQRKKALPPDRFRALVQHRMKNHRWHDRAVLQLRERDNV
jgi:5-methylcytosine-specific restriction endonuclease McrA